jgi:hypothetical protein
MPERKIWVKFRSLPIEFGVFFGSSKIHLIKNNFEADDSLCSLTPLKFT